MSVPASILDGLLEFWPLTDGQGSVARGALGQLDLSLGGGEWRAGAGSTAAGPDSSWNRAGEDPCCAAKLSAALPAAWSLLQNVGSTCTVAVEHWYSGFNTTKGVLDPAPPDNYGTTVTSVAFDQASFEAALAVYHAPQAPPAQDPANNTHVYFGTVPAGNGAATFLKAPPVALYNASGPVVLLADFERTAFDTVRCRLYADNTLWPDASPGYYDQVLPSGFDLSSIRFGDAPSSPTVFRAMAVWGRRLTGPERAALIDDGVGGIGGPLAGGPAVPTLLDGAGNPAIHPRHGASASALGSVVRAGPQGAEHARAVHGHAVLSRELSCELHSGAELDLVRRAFYASRGGAGVVLYRHPREDAAPRRHRMSGTLEVTRTRGGGFAAFPVPLTTE